MNKREYRFRDSLATGMYMLFVACIPIWLFTATWEQAIAFYIMYWFFGDVILSLFNHRFAAHDLWKPPMLVQQLFSVLSTLAFNNTPIAWSAFHRTHHKFVDTEKDPHSPSYKSWFTITFLYRYCTGYLKYAVDRLRVPYFHKVEKHEISILLVGHTSIIGLLTYFLGYQWALTLWVVPIGAAVFSINFFINVLAHVNGKAVDRPYLWPIVFSEAYHGSHHDKPKLSMCKMDLSGWIVRKLGWV